MTTLFMEPFSQYGGNKNLMLQGPWALDNSGNRFGLGVAPFDPSGAMSLSRGGDSSGSYSGGMRRVLASTKTVLTIGQRFGISSLPSGDGAKFVGLWLNSGGGMIARLCLGATGRLYLQNSSGVEVVSTQGPVIVASNYHHLEYKLDVSGGTASFVLRVDDATGTGTPAINATGLTGIVSAGPIGMLEFIPDQGWTQPFPYMKDLIVRDSAGTVNNGFNGDEHILALFADADTSNAGWTPRFYKMFGAGICNATAGYTTGYSCPSSTGTDLGAGDYTIEGFFRFNALPTGSTYSTIMSKWDTVNNKRSWRLIYGGPSFNTSQLQFDISTDGLSGTVATKIQYPWVPDLDVWYHIALVRVSGQLLLFVNGNQLGVPIADAATYYAGTEPMGVGIEVQGTTTAVANTGFNGWLDETRLTVGFARYSSSFAIPSSAFPRGAGSDAHWSNVALLCGYDSLIQDESSFVRTLTGYNSVAQKTVSDGPLVGNWSTMGANKTVPDDATFLTAPYTAATGTLTMTVQPANGDTVRVGTTNGVTAAVYTFKTTIASAFDVLIDTTAQNTLLNLYNAINLGTGIGTKYGTGTVANADVTAIQLPVGQLQMNANVLGTGGNSIITTSTGTAAVWGAGTMSGGANIPGYSDFKVQRPPAHTTVITAVQLNTRMFKSDAGLCSVEAGLVGALGGVNYGAIHPLTTSPVYYGDIIETDPDTAGPISPTTIINGALRLNRTA